MAATVNASYLAVQPPLTPGDQGSDAQRMHS